MRLPSRLPTEAAPIGDCLGKLPVARPPSQAALRPFLPSFLGRWVKNGCADATQNCFRWAQAVPYDARSARERTQATEGKPEDAESASGGSVLRPARTVRAAWRTDGEPCRLPGGPQGPSAAWLAALPGAGRSRTVRRLPLPKAGGGNAKQGGKNEQGILAS